MSDVVLQTATDEERERVVIRRIELATGWAGHRLGRFSRADYVMTVHQSKTIRLKYPHQL